MNSDDQIDISVQREIVTKAMTSIRVHFVPRMWYCFPHIDNTCIYRYMLYIIILMLSTIKYVAC
jgi:hypothetical protein